MYHGTKNGRRRRTRRRRQDKEETRQTKGEGQRKEEKEPKEEEEYRETRRQWVSHRESRGEGPEGGSRDGRPRKEDRKTPWSKTRSAFFKEKKGPDHPKSISLIETTKYYCYVFKLKKTLVGRKNKICGPEHAKLLHIQAILQCFVMLIIMPSLTDSPFNWSGWHGLCFQLKDNSKWTRRSPVACEKMNLNESRISNLY